MDSDRAAPEPVAHTDAGVIKVGALRHSIVLETPGTPTPDGDGGFIEAWTPLVPSPVPASIAPANARDLERIAAGTVLSVASHVVTMRYHPLVTTKTRITFGSRFFNVIGVSNPDERNEATIATAVEVVT